MSREISPITALFVLLGATALGTLATAALLLLAMMA